MPKVLILLPWEMQGTDKETDLQTHTDMVTYRLSWPRYQRVNTDLKLNNVSKQIRTLFLDQATSHYHKKL